MSQEASPPPRAHTAWHPLLVRLLRHLLPEEHFEVHAELLLHEQPQRIDTVVIRRTYPAPAPRAPALRELFLRFGAHNILELKGPSSALDGHDFTWLLGYAFQYMGKAALPDPEQLRLFVLSNRLSGPFLQMAQRHRVTFHGEAPGILRAAGLPFSLYIFETEPAQDRVLRLFSQALRRAPEALLRSLSEEERALLRLVYREIKHLQQDNTAPLRYADSQELTMSLDELYDEMLDDLPAERLLARLSPEERLRGLGPEGLSQALRGLDADQILAALDGLPEEQRALLLRRLLQK